MAPARSYSLLAVLLVAALAAGGCQAGGGGVASKKPSGSGVRPAAATKNSSVEFVKIATADGVKLSGRLFGRGRDGVVLGHMFPADQSSWGSFARTLADEGFAALTFDFRGYGLSEGTKDIAKIDRDMRAATEWLEERTDRVFIIGASMGGTAALRVGSTHQVRGVATLSAPPEFRGLSVGDRLSMLKGAKLFIAGSGDGSAANSARSFYGATTEPKELEVVRSARHGTDMLGEDGGRVADVLVDWLKRHR